MEKWCEHSKGYPGGRWGNKWDTGFLEQISRDIMLEIILRGREINKTKTQRNGGHTCWILDCFLEYNK